MTEQEAVDIVTTSKRRLELDPGLQVVSAELAIVEHMADRRQPGPVQNRLAWIIRMASANGMAEVRLDDRTREVFEVIR